MHQQLEFVAAKHAAARAIDRLFSFLGVPDTLTLESLQELRDELDVKIEALEQQIFKRGRNL